MNDTVITVLGNVGSDVRHAVTAKGALLTSFRLASTPRWPDRQTGEWVDGTTTWYSVVAWRNLADNVSASLNKGDPVIVHGRLRTVAWERDDRSGETLEIEAISIGPDLNRGRATYRRVIRAGAERTSGSGADAATRGEGDDLAGPGDRHEGAASGVPADAGEREGGEDTRASDTEARDTEASDTEASDDAGGGESPRGEPELVGAPG